jgi:iron complex outermembrane receptor protein
MKAAQHPLFKWHQIEWAAVLAVAALPVFAQQSLERVEITGSSVRRIDAESALPVQIIKREAIERSGYTSTADLIKNLPAVMGSTVESAVVGQESFGFAGVSIHNVGENRTLVLLNGRRLSPFGGQTLTGAQNAIDLNAIPISAIERIEVLTDGASALYGSDAIAGVVNFITRRGGTEGVATVGLSFPKGGARETNVSLSKGFGDMEADGFSVVLSAAADRRTALAAKERKFASTGVFNFSEGGQRYQFQQLSGRSIPANVYDLDFNAYNPYLQANGKCPPNHFADGTACRYDFSNDLEIYPERKRESLTASFDRQLAPGTKFFGDVVYSRSRSFDTLAYTPSELVIAPSSPYFAAAQAGGGVANPDLDGGILASYRFVDLGKRQTEGLAEAFHIVLGVDTRLGTWDVNLAYTHSQSDVRSSLTNGYGYNTRVLDALNTVVDPFALPGQQSGAAKAAIANAKYTGYWNGGREAIDGLELRGNTDLMPMGEGALQLGTGVSVFREKFSAKPSDLSQGIGDDRFGDDAANVPLDASRTALGAFAELVAPVTKSLELSAAVRFDRYSDFGSTTNGKFSGRWTPVEGLLIRGSVGTGYKAPSIFQVKGPRQKYGVSGGNLDCALADPNGVTLNDVATSLGATCSDGNQSDVIASGGADLKPEKSTQASLGFRVEPNPALSFGADYWFVGIRDSIGQVDQTAILSDYVKYQNNFTANVSKSSGLNLLALYQPVQNLGKEYRSGIDFDVVGRTELMRGMGLTSQLTATLMLRDDYQFEKDGSYYSSLGKYGDNGQVTFRWQGRWVNTVVTGDWAHTLTFNYKSSYTDADPVTLGLADVYKVNADGSLGDAVDSIKRKVSSYISTDWQTGYRMSKGLSINLGLINVFNTNPPRSLSVGGLNQGQQTGYDDRYYDPRGRTFYANLGYRF